MLDDVTMEHDDRTKESKCAGLLGMKTEFEAMRGGGERWGDCQTESSIGGLNASMATSVYG